MACGSCSCFTAYRAFQTASKWQVLEGVTPLYEQPLGSEAAIREFWSVPAAELELPLLTSLYDQGFYQGIFWEGDELVQAASELACLENHWVKMQLDATRYADLRDRAGYMREALKMANSYGGWVSIS
jgi:hypothetical protein